MATEYTYSLNPPSTDPAENKKLGYRTPRSILLPPYLSVNPYFTEFADSIDEVFEPLVDQKTEIIDWIRNMWITNPTMESTYVENNEMIPFSAWSQPERQIMVKQVNMLGMKLMTAGLLTDDNYQTISRWVGQYWFGKGTQSFIDFINYCLSSSLQIVNLWTEDYVNFVAAGDASIGTPIWEGGTWYPTTHVAIIAAGGLQQIDPTSLVNFFYEIANYNLVLYSLELSYDIWITDDPTLVRTDAVIVAIGLWADSSIVISNLFSYGASGPPTFDVSPSIPTKAYVETQPTNPASVYMLSAPSAWIASGNKVYPAYTTQDQVSTNEPSIPTTLCGGVSTNGAISGYTVIYGPNNWALVPGSSKSTARIPTFASIPVPRTVELGDIPTAIVGNLRANLLVNPDGWEDFTGTGTYTPYWIIS